MKYIKSCLNYTGGKYKLLPQIIPLIPRDIDTFYDIFCGGCNVGINVKANHIIFNDKMNELIELYKNLSNVKYNEIVSDIEKIIEKFALSNTFKNGYEFYNCQSSKGLMDYNRESYLKLRAEYNRLKIEKNTNDIYLNLILYILIVYGFNNQIRFNKKGQFNIPVGKRDFNQKVRSNLEKFISKIAEESVEFRNKDFKEFPFELIKKEDFVYLDPPYLVATATYNEQGGWNEDDEIELLSKLDYLNDKGIRFALSNVIENKGNSNNILEEWSKKYNINYLNYDYNNSNYQIKDKNQKTIEVLITNY